MTTREYLYATTELLRKCLKDATKGSTISRWQNGKKSIARHHGQRKRKIEQEHELPNIVHALDILESSISSDSGEWLSGVIKRCSTVQGSMFMQ